jgi:hypothetical protein
VERWEGAPESTMMLVSWRHRMSHPFGSIVFLLESLDTRAILVMSVAPPWVPLFVERFIRENWQPANRGI